MQEPNVLVQFLPLILIFVVFYFLLIRPQQKRMKEHRDMLAAIRRGDRIVTGGGIVGTVVKVGPEDELTVEIAEGVRVKVLRSTVSGVQAKTQPVKGAQKADAEGDGDAADAADSVEAAPSAAPERKGFGRFLSRK